MRQPTAPTPLPLRAIAPLALAAVLLAAGCASRGEALPVPQTEGGLPAIPDDAVAAVRTAPNGDVITEYRVQGQLRIVKVEPVRGPTYYLVDQDGDGRMDPVKGEVPTTWFKLFSW